MEWLKRKYKREIPWSGKMISKKYTWILCPVLIQFNWSPLDDQGHPAEGEDEEEFDEDDYMYGEEGEDNQDEQSDLIAPVGK